MSVHVHICECMYMCVEAERQARVSFLMVHPPIRLAVWPASSRDLPVPASEYWGYRYIPHLHVLKCGCWR